MDFGNIRYLTRHDHRDETGSSEFSSFDIETALVWQEFSQVGARDVRRQELRALH